MGLNMGKFKKDLHDPEISKSWTEDMKQAASLGVTATPTFFVNGKKVRGAKPKEAFKVIIDEMLKKK